MVYFIQRGDDGPIKIGFSEIVPDRIRMLQTGSAEKLKLRALMEGSLADERAIHAMFEEGRMSGEWFRSDTPGLQDFMAAVGITLPGVEDKLCAKCGTRAIAEGNRKYCDGCSPKQRPQFTAEDDARLEAALLRITSDG